MRFDHLTLDVLIKPELKCEFSFSLNDQGATAQWKFSPVGVQGSKMESKVNYNIANQKTFQQEYLK